MPRHRISAVIALVIYFLSTSLVITDCRGQAAAEEQSGGGGNAGIPHEYYNSSLTAAATETSSSDQMPPIDLLMQMSCATDVEDFLKFIDQSSIDAKVNIVNRAIGLERSSVQQAKMATCKPEATVVPLLPDGASPTDMFFPSCTRVNRCGGCCSHSLLSCQPTATETLTFQVIKSQWDGSKFQFRNKEIILVEQHTKCSCQCAVREEHCNTQQKYFPGQCQCVCQNAEEQEKCFKQSEIKLWDSTACQCVCRKSADCTTGSYFNPSTCQCLKIPIYSNQAANSQSPEDRKKFIIRAFPLPSGDTTKYSTTN